MLASEVIKVSIERPFAEVYDFLADPLNFTRWAATPDSTMEPLDGGLWQVEVPSGRRTIRFSPYNNFGVLDYEVFEPGKERGRITPVRLVANGGGCELVLLWLRQAGTSDERFASDVQWIASDLQRLKVLLEGG